MENPSVNRLNLQRSHGPIGTMAAASMNAAIADDVAHHLEPISFSNVRSARRSRSMPPGR